jgi:outer membrane autotransporter protein
VDLGSARGILTLTDSMLDLSSTRQNGGRALIRFGGTVDMDASNTLILPLLASLFYGDVALLEAGEVAGFAPDLFSPGFTVGLMPGYTARYTGFAAVTPNSARLFPAFSAYAGSQMTQGQLSEAQVLAMANNPENLTAQSYASQAQVARQLYGSVRQQAHTMSRQLGQNTRNRLVANFSQNLPDHTADAGMLFTDAPALDLVEKSSPTAMGVSGGSTMAQAYHFFGGYLHGRRTQDKNKGYSGYDFDTDGILLGTTADLNRDFNLSLYAALTESDTDYDDIAAKVESNGAHLGAIGRYRVPLAENREARLSGWLAYSHLANDAERHTCAGASLTKSSYDQNVFGAGAQAALDWHVPVHALTVSPYVALEYTHLKQDSLHEKGPNALRTGSLRLNETSSTVGIELHKAWKESELFAVGSSLNLGWRHSFDAGSQHVSTRFTGYAPSFASYGQKEDANTLLGGLALDLRWLKPKNPLLLRLEYGFQKQDKMNDHTIFLGMEARF